MRRVLLFCLIFFILFVGCASAATLEVGEGYTYPTVNAAYSAAVSGDTILIHPGTYNERLTIKNIHDLTIEGIGHPTIFHSIQDSNPCILLDTNVYNITIKKLHLINDGSSTVYSGGIRAGKYYTHGLIFEDNIIETYSGNGIFLHGTGVYEHDDLFHCNDTRITNNTITTTGEGLGISIYANPTNLTIEQNDIAVSNNWTFMTETAKCAYGLKVDYCYDAIVKNNIIRSSSYSLLCCYGENVTVENNTAYGKATHNCYESGYVNGIFRNNTLIDTNRTWAYANSGRIISLNNFYSPGTRPNGHMVIENIYPVNVTEGRMVQFGGHQHNVILKNVTLDAPAHNGEKIMIYGLSATGVGSRTSDGLIIDNLSILNHTPNAVPMFIQGSGTDSTPTTHTKGDYADITRDNITFYDVNIQNIGYPSSDLWIVGDIYDANVSVMDVNSNLTTNYIHSAGGGIVSSIEKYYFTDIDITDNGEPAGTSRIFVSTNTTRLNYNEPVPYFTGNYVNSSKTGYVYQQSSNGRLYTPEYIETLSNGQTGTRSNPDNCLILASTTKCLISPTSAASINTSNVYYNLTVSGGAFDSPCFYTTPTGTHDIITIDATGNYAHKYGTKSGSVTGYHPINTMYKTNSYERGTVDLTIPITEYETTVIPMGVTM